MNNSTNTAVGIKGFTPVDFYSGTAGLAPGGDTDFGALVVVQDIAPASEIGQIFGNYNDPAGVDNTQGWRILRLPDSTTDGADIVNYACEVYGGADTITVTISIRASNSRGRISWLGFTFDASTDTLDVYANGALTGSSTLAITPLASTLGPTIGGHSVDAVPASSNAVFAAGYFTTLNGGLVLSNSFVETLKRCDLVPVTGVAFDFQYNIARNSGWAGADGNGYPRILTNYGSTAPAGSLTKQGTSTLQVATPNVVWAGDYFVEGV